MSRIVTSDLHIPQTYGLAALVETGELVTCGRKDSGPNFLYFYTSENPYFEMKKIPVLCKHNDVSLSSIVVQSQEYLLVTCSPCHDIKLIDLKTKKVVCEVYAKFHSIQSMCPGGEPGRLFIHHVRDILELDCSRLQFKEIKAIPTSINVCRNLCYVPSPHNLIVAIDGNCREITAVSTHSKETVWTVDEIDGKEIYVAIRAIVYSPTHNAILVGVLEKIFVLNPADGSHVQTIPLPGIGGIFDMCFLKNRMFAIHGSPTASKISCFSLN